MTILTEMVGDRIRHYSDRGVKIRQIERDLLYEDAVDVIPCRFTYEETDIPIPETEASAQEVLDILMGDDNNG